MTLAGSFPYMSPEVYRVGAVPAAASDCWSFGVLLWEVLTREVPWDDVEEADISIAVALRGARPADASEGAATATAAISPRLRRVVEVCLSKAPEERPSCGEALDAIRGAEREGALN